MMEWAWLLIKANKLSPLANKEESKVGKGMQADIIAAMQAKETK